MWRPCFSCHSRSHSPVCRSERLSRSLFFFCSSSKGLPGRGARDVCNGSASALTRWLKKLKELHCYKLRASWLQLNLCNSVTRIHEPDRRTIAHRTATAGSVGDIDAGPL